MTLKATLICAVAAGFWSPAVSDELRPMQYNVTVLEQVRHHITVEAVDERAARAIALLEAGRTGALRPAWTPSPPAVLANVHEVDDFHVLDIKPLSLPSD